METITIEEFKKLVGSIPEVDRMESPRFGFRFAVNKEVCKKRCENLTVGDTVFFLNAVYKGLGEDNIPELEYSIIQARVVEPFECRETITIDKFKNLVSAKDRKEAYGLFAMNEEAHKKQCENLKVGDTVFYLATKEGTEEICHDHLCRGIPTVDIAITQATVVEDK